MDWRAGDPQAPERLFAAVHPELKRIAARFLFHEREDQTLEPNALVNELCVRLLGGVKVTYTDRVHFYAIAAKTMRRILIDHARARAAEKRGGERARVSLSAVEGWNPVVYDEDLVGLDRALSKLERADSRAAKCASSEGCRKTRSRRPSEYQSSR